MPVSSPDYIHLQNGRLTGDTGPQDVDAMLDAYAAAAAPAGLAIHFHGGVVSKAEGLATAARLGELYRAAGAFPLFYVWESGLAETLRNNLKEICGESFFRRLMARLAAFTLDQFSLLAGAARRGLMPGDLQGSPDKLKKEHVEDVMAAWFSQQDGARAALPSEGNLPRENVPPFENVVFPTRTPRDESVDAIQRRIEGEVAGDAELRRALAAIGRSRDGVAESPTRSHIAPTDIAPADLAPADDLAPTRMSADGLNKLLGPPATATRSLLSRLANLVAEMALLVHRTSQRIRTGRDHGVFLTLVEEVLRSLYLGSVGKTIWDQMKQDTADAFGDDLNLHGGTALLTRLARRLEQGMPVPRITLTGHSTGAVYICNFLRAAQRLLPAECKFDVVFLAPAVRCREFAETLAECGERINGFRTFAMSDELERRDALVPVAYPRSLLYFVSGVLEAESDEPLVGMQRYFDPALPLTAADDPQWFAAREYVTIDSRRAVWSLADGEEGWRSQAARHAAFDDEEQTIASVCRILSQGF